jgi:hypothetical protein
VPAAPVPGQTDEKFLLLFSKRSAFFFERKKQKTFIRLVGRYFQLAR